MVESAKAKFDIELQKQARLFCVIYNANGGIDGKPVKLEDLLPEVAKNEKPMTSEQYCEGWKTWAQSCKNGV